VNPLVGDVALAVALGDHNAGERVVVAALSLGLGHPSGEVGARSVLRFQHEALAVDPYAAYVAPVFRPRLDSPINAVVVEHLGEPIGYLALEPSPCLPCASICSCHCSHSPFVVAIVQNGGLSGNSLLCFFFSWPMSGRNSGGGQARAHSCFR
jgi:hypothetical protein